MTLIEKASAWLGEGDSFSRIGVTAKGKSVEVDYGVYGSVTVSSMKALRESLPHRCGVNVNGLLSGEVLTALGRMRFSVRACPDHTQPHQASVSLDAQGVSVGNLTYERLHITNYTERSSYLNFGGWSVRGGVTTHSWDWSRALSRAAYQASEQVKEMLVTPAFHHALDIEVQQAVIAAAEKKVAEAERYYLLAQDLLASQSQEDKHGYAI